MADAGQSLDAAIVDDCSSNDRDGDGFGTHPSCPVIDCDDTNIGVFPGAYEACNGADDDCDDAIDEDLGEGSCGVGACRVTQPFCRDGRPVACTPGQGSAELCNGVDDDCDGEVDEGVSGERCGTGACERTARCEGGVFGACVPGASETEVCNRIDDDCNGVVDDGFRIEVVNGSYLALSGLHAQCDGATERMGPNCNAAIHRFCAGQGCSTSGVGPLENSGDLAILACVTAEPSIDVPFATLAAQHPGCTVNSRIGSDCNAAIHRYCASRGYASGFGPVEQGAESALVTCLRGEAARVEVTSYTVLMGHHDGCTAQTRLGPACNAAISRFCGQRGFRTGFGPVENSGDTAVVTCLVP